LVDALRRKENDVSEREPHEDENEVEGHLLGLDRNDDSTTESKPETLRDDSDDEDPDVEAHGGWRSF
jgi:hypothetical protein